jgi:hypothetical protein
MTPPGVSEVYRQGGVESERRAIVCHRRLAAPREERLLGSWNGHVAPMLCEQCRALTLLDRPSVAKIEIPPQSFRSDPASEGISPQSQQQCKSLALEINLMRLALHGHRSDITVESGQNLPPAFRAADQSSGSANAIGVVQAAGTQ